MTNQAPVTQARFSSAVIALVALLACESAATAAATHLVGCVGDSITWGYLASDQSTTAYPDRLQTLLGSTYQTENYGQQGATLLINGDNPYSDGSTNLAYDESNSDIPSWTGSSVDVVIELGTNDSKSQNWAHSADFLGDCHTLVEHYATMSTHPRVWINLVPPAFANGYGIDGTIISEQINPLLQQCATDEQISTIDVYSAFMNLPDPTADISTGDGVHPNDAGYLLIAQTVFHALTNDLAVSLSAPTAGATFEAPATIALEALAMVGASSTISKVDFLEADGTVVGTSTSSPYTFTWNNVGAGNYSLLARATDAEGATVVSSPIAVVVQGSSGGGGSSSTTGTTTGGTTAGTTGSATGGTTGGSATGGSTGAASGTTGGSASGGTGATTGGSTSAPATGASPGRPILVTGGCSASGSHVLGLEDAPWVALLLFGVVARRRRIANS